jgi:hypothetical protein
VNRLRTLLRNERGNVMVSNLVGAFVMTVVAGAIATSIAGLLLFQTSIGQKTGTTKSLSMVDAVFRSDVLWASEISTTTAKSVQMTVPGRDGKCKVSSWAIDTVDGKTELNITVVSYPAFDATVNPIRCSGTGSAPSTQTLATDLSGDTAFNYTNTGGRPVSYTAGAPELQGPADAPTGTSAKSWASTSLGAIALDVTFAASTAQRATYRIAQAGGNLSVLPAAPDAATHFIPEGDLTAIPAG